MCFVGVSSDIGPSLFRIVEAGDAKPVLHAPRRTSLTARGLRSALVDQSAILAEAGISRGTRVFTVLPNAPSTAIALLGLCENATVIPGNPALTINELSNIIGKANIDAIITRPENQAVCDLARQCNLGLLN